MVNLTFLPAAAQLSRKAVSSSPSLVLPSFVVVIVVVGVVIVVVGVVIVTTLVIVVVGDAPAVLF